ncbi:MAG TPA: CsgG/HfaB family protein [Geobacteraceae bacterium]
MKRIMFCVVAVSLLSAGCAAPKITVMKLEPGKSVESARLRKVAVLPFDGPDGANFAAEFEGKLASIVIDDKQFFEVVNRSALDKVMDEMKLSQSGLVNPDTAAQVGKMIGAKGIYIGQITKAKVHDSKYVEDRSECAARNDKGKCTSWNKTKVDCIKRTADFNVTPKLVEVETARIIYADNYSRNMEAKRCADSNRALQSHDEMIHYLQKSTLDAIRNDIAPFYQQVQIQLMNDKDGIPSEAAKDKLASGLEFAKNRRFDRACEIWTEAKALAPSAVSLLHNLAVCAEVGGRLDEALALLKEADRQLAAPHEAVTASLERVTASIAKQRKLKSQTMTE